MSETTPTLAIFKDKLYQSVDSPLFQGWEELKTIKAADLFLNWKGAKIPLSVWYPVVAFMRKFHEHECMARLYYNTELAQWKYWVWPQKYGTGMTIVEYDKHPNREVQWDAQFGPGWDSCGTIHHHCNCSAFQSSTDSNDEKNAIGLHITLGKMKDATLDFHGRGCFRGNFYGTPFSSWFELSAEQKAIIPEALEEVVLKYFLLSHLPEGTTWPKEWEENLIKPAPITGSVGFQTGFQYGSHQPFKGPAALPYWAEKQKQAEQKGYDWTEEWESHYTDGGNFSTGVGQLHEEKAQSPEEKAFFTELDVCGLDALDLNGKPDPDFTIAAKNIAVEKFPQIHTIRVDALILDYLDEVKQVFKYTEIQKENGSLVKFVKENVNAPILDLPDEQDAFLRELNVIQVPVLYPNRGEDKNPAFLNQANIASRAYDLSRPVVYRLINQFIESKKSNPTTVGA